MTDKNKVVEDVATAAGQTLQTKSAAMSGILAMVSAMSHEELMQWWPDAQALAADISPSAAAQNQASIQMKPSAAMSGTMKEETDVLFEGESLSEDARLKVAVLIENAVDVRAAIIREEIEEQYRERLVEETVKIQEELVDKIDSYATYAAEQFVEKNQVAIESTIKVERANRLIEGLSALMAECGVEISEDKIDVVESLESKVADLQDKLNEMVDDNVELHRSLTALSALNIFRESTEGLTAIETEKFKKLVEDVDVDVDPADLRRKLDIIREAHFGKSGSKAKSASADLAEQMTSPETAPAPLNEETQKKISDPRVARYADAISRASSDRYARGPYAR